MRAITPWGKRPARNKPAGASRYSRRNGAGRFPHGLLMQLVVDASVAVKWFVEEEDAERASLMATINVRRLDDDGVVERLKAFGADCLRAHAAANKRSLEGRGALTVLETVARDRCKFALGGDFGTTPTDRDDAQASLRPTFQGGVRPSYGERQRAGPRRPRRN